MEMRVDTQNWKPLPKSSASLFLREDTFSGVRNYDTLALKHRTRWRL